VRTLALDNAAVNLNEDHTTIDRPCREKWRDQGHLSQRDSSQAIESLPREITRLAIRLLLLLLLGGLRDRITRDYLSEKVHQSE